MAGTLIYKQQLISGAPAVTDNVTPGNMRPVTSNAVAAAINNQVFLERQKISVSGFNGEKRESLLTFTDLHEGYKRTILHVSPNSYNTYNYIMYWGNCTEYENRFYIEHTLAAAVNEIEVTVLYMKD